MVDEISTRAEWESSGDEEAKRKLYWRKVKRKAYRLFKDRYVAEVNEFQRELDRKAASLSPDMQAELRPIIDSIPTVVSVPELDRIMDRFEAAKRQGEEYTASGAYDLLVSLTDEHGDPLFPVTPESLPAVENEDLRRDILRQKDELQRIFRRFAEEILPAASPRPPRADLKSWWTIYKILRVIEKVTGVMLKGLDLLLKWLMNKEELPEEEATEERGESE